MDHGRAPLVDLSAIAPSLDGEQVTLTVETPSDDEEDELPINKIPDGGWGWIVVFASLIMSMIADGISLSFGMLYVEFLDEFGASKSVTSWIGSLFMSVPLLSGPVMSAFVDKYGCRSMTIIGGLISATGFVISSRIQSIGWMYITFGFLSGLGLGLCYVTAVVSIAFWFDKKRTLAVGLGAAGTGIGTFVFSPLTMYLLSEFGWRGTTLLLAGAFLNICVCGAFFRDPAWIIKQNHKLTKSGKSSKTSLMSISSALQNTVNVEELKALLQSGRDAQYLLQNLQTTTQTQINHCQSVVSLPTFIKQNEKVPIEVLEQLQANKRLYKVILENYPSLLLCKSSSDKNLNHLVEDPERYPVTFSLKLKKEKQEEEAPPKRNSSFPWLKKQSVCNQNYFKNMKFHRQSLVHRGAIFNTKKYRLRASSCPNIYRVSMTSVKCEEKWYSEVVELVRGMFNFSLFLEFHFFLMSLSTIILFVWFIVPYFYLAEHMIRWKYTPEQISLTVSNIGVTNTIGMILLGWAGDQDWMNLTKTYAISLVLCGLSCAGMMYFTYNYVLLEVFAALFGLSLSGSFSFTPGILVELVPLERFTVAYGLQLLCMGIGNLLGPPLAGHLFDVTGKWEQSFYQAAIWIIVSGGLIAVIPYTKNRKIIGTGPVEKELDQNL